MPRPTLAMKTFAICPLVTCLLSFCSRVIIPLRSFLSFFVFFAVEVLILLPRIKKPKAKMNINAKKTNYTLENAIQSSCFVLPLRKLFFILSQLICMSPDGNRNIHSPGAKAFRTSIVVARTSFLVTCIPQ